MSAAYLGPGCPASGCKASDGTPGTGAQLRLPRRPHVRGVEGGTSAAGRIRDLVAIRGHVLELVQSLDREGASYPASYVRSACGSLDLAIEGICVLAERERPERMISRDGKTEHLTLTDGRGTGVLARRVGDGSLAVRGRYSAEGEFVEQSSADAKITVPTRPDLAWDLLNSPEARRIADGDVAAALLVRALSRTQWLHAASGMRWSASQSGAALVVRLLRDGRAAPELAHEAPLAIDQEVSGCIANLHWHSLATFAWIEGANGHASPPVQH